jgi:hypothetical protein
METCQVGRNPSGNRVESPAITMFPKLTLTGPIPQMTRTPNAETEDPERQPREHPRGSAY